MGFLVEDEGTALMWRGLILTKAVEQFLTDVRWGDIDYLLVDMPPGTGDIQMGLARLLPQAEMLVVTTPARAAQKVATRVADMARRSFMKVVGVVENMSEFVTPDGSVVRAVRRGRRRRARPPRSARRSWAAIPLEPAVSAGRRHGHARPRSADTRQSPAGAAFHDARGPHRRRAAAAGRDGGCTARIFELRRQPRRSRLAGEARRDR